MKGMTIDAAKIKSSVSLIALLRKDGVVLQKSSNHFICLCPFHREKSGSCHVWEDHWYCFGCGSCGDAITYLRQTRCLTFMEAVRMLGEGQFSAPQFHPVPARVVDAEMIPDFTALMLRWQGDTTEQQMDDLAAKLGVAAAPLWWLGVAYAPEHRAWAFPMRDATHRTVGIRLRDERGKKWAVKGSKQGLFIPWLECDSRLFVTEGPTDAAACLTLGFYAIGRPSCHGCVDFVNDLLKRERSIRDVVLVTDNDEAGIKGANTLRTALRVRSYQIVLPPKDIRRFVQLGGGKLMIEAMLQGQVSWNGQR